MTLITYFLKVPYTALTKEEKEFLISAHIDVESQDEEDDPGQDEADVDDHSFGKYTLLLHSVKLTSDNGFWR